MKTGDLDPWSNITPNAYDTLTPYLGIRSPYDFGVLRKLHLTIISTKTKNKTYLKIF